MDGPLFEIPPLFNILCFVTGSTFLLSPVFWLWHIRYGTEDAGYKSLSYIVFTAILRVVFLGCVLSLFYGLKADPWTDFVPEIALIVVMIGGFVVRRPCFSLSIVLEAVLEEIQSQLSLIVSLIVLWAGVLALFFLCFVLSSSAGVVGGVIELSVAFLGGLGFLVLLLFYRRVLAEKPDHLPDFFAFHNLLWPLVIGLFLLIVPLLLYKIAHDPKLIGKLHTPPLLQRA